ncbi:hypothetical protein U1Q18_026772 [Sarracenia purpurea var. burkii]
MKSYNNRSVTIAFVVTLALIMSGSLVEGGAYRLLTTRPHSSRLTVASQGDQDRNYLEADGKKDPLKKKKKKVVVVNSSFRNIPPSRSNPTQNK